MREFLLYEIEANEKPILSSGEWELLQEYTSNIKAAKDRKVVAYGEIKDEKYIRLYRNTN
jgi:hypothetical protein